MTPRVRVHRKFLCGFLARSLASSDPDRTRIEAARRSSALSGPSVTTIRIAAWYVFHFARQGDKFVRLRHLVIVNASLLILTGILFWFGPVNVLLEGYGFPPVSMAESVAEGSGAGYGPQALGRLLGVVCLGFGLLLLALHDVGDSRLGRRAAGALCAANAAGFLAALTQQISIWESAQGWVTAGVFLALTLGYGALLALPQDGSTQRRTPVARNI